MARSAVRRECAAVQGEAWSETLPLGAMSEMTGLLLRIAQLKAFARFYETFGARGIKPGEFSILWFVALNPGVRQGVVANTLMIKRSNMAKITQVFVDRKLVRRHVPDHDRRSVCLTLTAAGAAYVERALEDVMRHDRGVIRALSDRERETLIRLLSKIIDNS